MCSEERDKGESSSSYDEDEDDESTDRNIPYYKRHLLNKFVLKSEIADRNNNSGNREEDCDYKFNDNRALDLSKVPSYRVPSSHVTLEALQNTKVAVAQFAATAIANTSNYEDAIKDLAVVQSTLFNLQHQQLLQIQLIQQLQSQLSVHQVDNKDNLDESEESNAVRESGKDEESWKKKETAEEDKCTVEVKLLLEEKLPIEEKLPVEEKLPEENTNENETNSQLKIENQHNNSVNEVKDEIKAPQKPADLSLQSPLCNINSSLAFSIITNHDPPPPPDEPNSLEMLQKRTQEVLDSASQSLLGNNLADEFAFGKDRSADGKGRNEPFFKHRCKYCGKVFGSDSALQIHIRSHTGERPFKCNVCASKFTTKGNLKVHYQRHTQKYPTPPLGPNCIPEYPNNFHPKFMSPLTPPQLGHFSAPKHPSSAGELPFPPGPPFLPLVPFRSPMHNMMRPHGIPHPCPSPPILDQEEPADLSIPLKSHNSNRKEIEAETSKFCKEDASKPSKRISLKPILQNIPKEEDTKPMSTYSQYSGDSDDSDQEQPENLSKRSSVSRNSSLSDSTPENAKSMGWSQGCDNGDTSWESWIEIDKMSETSKLQELVDNIENKITDPNQCPFCQRYMACRSALQMHIRTHTGERPYRCKICSRAFATKGNLKAHMCIHKIKPPVRSQMKCPVCHQRYPNSSALQMHIQTHAEGSSDGRPSEEDQKSASRTKGDGDNIDAPFSDFSGLNSESSHGDYDDFIEDENDDDSLQNSAEMARFFKHDQHFIERGKQFSRDIKILPNGALDLTPRNTQSQSPDGESPTSSSAQAACSDSSKTFGPSSKVLSSLPQSHLSKSPFNPLGICGLRGNLTCHICFKTFACNSALEIHFRSHTKERPFKCSICDKAFTTKKEEVVHTALHFFNPKGNMKQHLLTHKQREFDSRNSSQSADGNYAGVSKDESQKSEEPEFDCKQTEIHQNGPLQAGYHFSFNNGAEDSKSGTKRPLPDIEQPLAKRPIASSPLSVGRQSVSPPQEAAESQTTLRLQTPAKDPQPQRVESQLSTQLDPPVNTKHLCTVCRKNFSSSSALQIHMRTHTGDKPFRCSVCQKAFTTKGNLKVHMGTHMWTNGSSRRGRRMSLELPLNRSLPIGPQEEFISRRTDLFYPYLPPFLNGIQQKFNEMGSLPSPQNGFPTGFGHLPPAMQGKYSGFLGFSPFFPHHGSAAQSFHQPLSASSPEDKQPNEEPNQETVTGEQHKTPLEGDGPRLWDDGYPKQSPNGEGRPLQRGPEEVSRLATPHEETLAV